jgi:DNA-binding NtrC family response regulator
MALQAKLLRFLQNYSVTPVGSNQSHTVDVRIIAATNREPVREVAAGRFREDLYYRLHVVPIHLPRLAERGGDIIEIALSFLTDYAREEGKGFVRFSEEATQALASYAWPGNVRQLQNIIRGIVALHDGPFVTIDMLPREVVEGERAPILVWSNAGPLSPDHVRPLWEIEKDAIEDAVTLCEGNIHRAAALLEVSPSTIYRKRMNWGDAPAANDASA